MPVYAGKLLRIDLTHKTWREEPIADEAVRKWLLGSGLAAKIYYEEMDPALDPLDPASPLIVMNGVLAGTFAPTGCRSSWCGRSPLTGIWNEANLAHYWGAELRMAGYDGLIITGRAESPTYLWINGVTGAIEFRDAGHLWGRDWFEAGDALLAETDPKGQVAGIGTAGERLIKIAGIMCGPSNYVRAATRGGMGALLGSKNLKAIAVRGKARPEYPDPKRFRDEVKAQNEFIKEHSQPMSNLGTAGGVHGHREVRRPAHPQLGPGQLVRGGEPGRPDLLPEIPGQAHALLRLPDRLRQGDRGQRRAVRVPARRGRGVRDAGRLRRRVRGQQLRGGGAGELAVQPLRAGHDLDRRGDRLRDGSLRARADRPGGHRGHRAALRERRRHAGADREDRPPGGHWRDPGRGGARSRPPHRPGERGVRDPRQGPGSGLSRPARVRQHGGELRDRGPRRLPPGIRQLLERLRHSPPGPGLPQTAAAARRRTRPRSSSATTSRTTPGFTTRWGCASS